MQNPTSSQVVWHSSIGGGRFAYGTRESGERVKVSELSIGLVIVETLDAEALPIRGLARSYPNLPTAVLAEAIA